MITKSHLEFGKNFTLRLLRNLRGFFWKAKWIATSNWPISVQGSVPVDAPQSKTLLVIYDFISQPFSVGDILTVQAASLVVSEEEQCESVDMAMVFDKHRPAIRGPAYSHINDETFFFHLSSILPAAQVNPKLGSLLLFDSHQKLEKYLADNLGRYKIWPKISDYSSREYLFYNCMNGLFPTYHQAYGQIPQLRSRGPAAKWANAFLDQHNPSGKRTVSVQIRHNIQNPSRNSNYSAWEKFFTDVSTEYQAIFFVVCGPSELPTKWRSIKNVVLVKDFHTTLEQDLALISACDCHMGASSGPGMMAILGQKPYRMYGYDGDAGRLTCLRADGARQYFSFSAKNQYLIRERETSALLKEGFLELSWVDDRPPIS